ncbi:MAG: hypothetical protein C0402_05785 [Thermodesulfovibrio sp.]|nr:hypothetical protein [Thermodesulfovibrio sp.]
MNTYVYEKIDHRPGGNAASIISSLRDIFVGAPEGLREVRQLAAEVAELVSAMGPAQQKACAAVCPECRSVCCINRHAFHEHEDIVYLAALGEKMPSYTMRVPDTDPCQFLGAYGCTVGRHLRPHRCNTYFCSPMLEYLENGPAPQYRRFICGLQLVTKKREEMLEAFYNKAYSF